MGIDWENYWMKESQRGGYIIWRNIDKEGKFIYQATKGEMPLKDDGGYYSKLSLLKLKGIVS